MRYLRFYATKNKSKKYVISYYFVKTSKLLFMHTFQHYCIACLYLQVQMSSRGSVIPWDFHRLHRAELQDQLDEELLLLLRSSWFISAQWRDCVPVLSKWLSCLTTQFWGWSAACCSFMMCETSALFALRLFSGKGACAPHCLPSHSKWDIICWLLQWSHTVPPPVTAYISLE